MNNYYHKFGELKTDKLSSKNYRKCQACGVVFFDPEPNGYLNVYCKNAVDNIEATRKRLSST
jgi:hypothetical protein